MNFNTHSNLVGAHAFLGASSYHWLNYDEDKLIRTYNNYKQKLIGTQMHEFAATSINLGIKLSGRGTLAMYVNDAIKLHMSPEVVLVYSDNVFGTTDAISFEKDFLRIHDLKTGVTPASLKQLQIYMALFCLEYGISPMDIGSELRIYQNDQIISETPDDDRIRFIMDKIIEFDRTIDLIN